MFVFTHIDQKPFCNDKIHFKFILFLLQLNGFWCMCLNTNTTFMSSMSFHFQCMIPFWNCLLFRFSTHWQTFDSEGMEWVVRRMFIRFNTEQFCTFKHCFNTHTLSGTLNSAPGNRFQSALLCKLDMRNLSNFLVKF